MAHYNVTGLPGRRDRPCTAGAPVPSLAEPADRTDNKENNPHGHNKTRVCHQGKPGRRIR